MSAIFTYILYLYKTYLLLAQKRFKVLFLFNFYAKNCEENVHFYIVHV